jgi:phospholipase C
METTMSQTVQPNAPLPGIEHIVVLMLENRSFDNVLGNLYPPSAAFDGIPAGASNAYQTIFGHWHTVTPTNTPPSGKSIYITPNPDPAEEQGDMATQIDNGTMGGFAQSYYTVLGSNPGDIMCYFDSTANGGIGQLPITKFIASSYAVSDQWFGSGPVQTFPNRMFAFCAMPGQFGNTAPIDNIDYFLQGSGYSEALGSVTSTTVFELLDQASNSTGPDPTNWKVYFHDVPLSALSSYVYDAWNAGSDCVSSFDDSDYTPPYGTTFASDVQNNTLPAFAWIEPRYWSNYSGSGALANSNHPADDSYVTLGLTGNPIDCRNGEALLVEVIGALLSNPDLFNSTLLIVIYDENGGIWDHVSPRPALTPYGPNSGVKNADVYSSTGPRVPAMFANPSIPAGTVYRPASGSTYPFDHTSIIATLTAQFGLAGPLTPRDGAAPVLENLIPTNATARSAAELAFPDAALSGLPKSSGTPAPRKPMGEHQRMVSEWVESRARK